MASLAPPPLQTSAPAPAKSRPHTLLALFVVVASVTTADLLLSRGAKSAPLTDPHGLLATLGIAALASPFTIVGILFHLCGLAAWLYTLRHVPLTIAYCFTAIQQASIALGAWLWLGEQISPLRWLGIAIVVAGVFILVPSVVQSDTAAERTRPPRVPA